MLILDTDHLVEYQKGTSAESQRLKDRLAQMDMKIASIALARRATLLTRNRCDFEQSCHD
jgi:predicted nucleic acid-binding protein